MPQAVENADIISGWGKRWWIAYALVPIFVGISLLVRTLLLPVLHSQTPFLYFVPAVLVASGIGGAGPALLATGLSLICVFTLFVDPAELSAAYLTNTAAFALISIGVSWGGELLRRGRQRTLAMTTRSAGARSACAVDSRHGAGGDRRHRRARHHAFVQRRRRAPVRLHRERSHRPERQDSDAGAVSRSARRLSRPLRPHRRAAHHRHRPRRRRHAQGRLDLPDGARRRRDELRQPALLHRLHPRPDRAAEHRSAPAGAAIRARAHLAPHRHGRDGLDARARAQPAAVGDLQLSQRLAGACWRAKPTSARSPCATRSTRRATRPCAPARSSAGCATSSRAAKASAGSKASPSWSRRRARWRWSASRTAASTCVSNSTPRSISSSPTACRSSRCCSI